MKNAAYKMLGLSTLVLGLISSSSFAAEATQLAKEPSVETRQQMASAHQKMADCLKSALSLSECRNEMKASCKEMAKVGGERCPMMDGMGPMKGHHNGMRPTESNEKS